MTVDSRLFVKGPTHEELRGRSNYSLPQIHIGLSSVVSRYRYCSVGHAKNVVVHLKSLNFDIIPIGALVYPTVVRFCVKGSLTCSSLR
jgi:hypothetical protein